jgi:hypothetical protein
MFKRLFWLAVGLGLGAGLAVLIMRRVEQVMKRSTPPEIAHRTGASVTALLSDIRDAIREGAEAMRVREAEIWTEVESDTPVPPTTW